MEVYGWELCFFIIFPLLLNFDLLPHTPLIIALVLIGQVVFYAVSYLRRERNARNAQPEFDITKLNLDYEEPMRSIYNADTLAKICPAHLAGKMCVKYKCKDLVLCEIAQEYYNHTCNPACPFQHGIPRTCLRALDNNCSDEDCELGHDFMHIRKLSFEASACHTEPAVKDQRKLQKRSRALGSRTARVNKEAEVDMEAGGMKLR